MIRLAFLNSVAVAAGLALTLSAVPVVADPSVANAPAGSPWSTLSHPCPGANRTDALYRDADGVLWVGCGTNAVGYGLFRSGDGGSAWTEVTVAPAGKLDTFRVSSISRGHDGALYVAGINASASPADMVLRLQTTGAMPYPVNPVLVAGTQSSFHVGTYRELGDGRALAESLTGTGLLYRPNAGVGPSANDWLRIDGTSQMLDLVVHDDRFYGAGSTIIDPPRVFLPPTAPGAEPHDLVALDLQGPSGWEGELWALAVNARRLVAVGVDQDSNIGKIFVSGADPYAAGGYTEFSVSPITGDNFSWARGVCMRGDRIVVVGERQPLSAATGRVLLSNDGGASFANVSPAGVAGTITRCTIEPDGTVVVVGAGGYVGIRQDPDWIFVNDLERW